MADRYWVGGTGNWDTTTTHWSATSGGAGGASVPTASDNAIFNAASGTNFTVTIATASRTCLSLTVTSPNNMTLAGSQTLTISGGLTFPATGLTNTYTGAITFASGTTQNITTNGITLASAITFSSAGPFTLQSALTTTGAVTLTTGTIVLNGYTFSMSTFSQTTINTCSLDFTAAGSTINLSGSGTVWNVPTTGSLTVSGTPKVRLTNSGSVATTITNTFSAQLSFAITAGTYALTITATSLFIDLDFTGFSGSFNTASTVSVYGNLTYSSTMTTGTSSNISLRATSGTKTITTNGATISNNISFNGVGGTFQLADNFTQSSSASFTIQNGTIDFNNKVYTIGILTFAISSASYINYGGTLSASSIVHNSGAVTTGTGALLSTAGTYTFTAGSITINNGVNLSVGIFSSANSNTRSIAFGTGSITTTGTGTVWNVTGTTGLSYTGASNIIISNNTATAATITNTATAASAMNFNIINGTYALTLTSGASYNNLNFTGFAGTIAFAANTYTIYGNLTLASGTVTSATAGTNTFSWISTSGTRTITSNGATANFGISLNGVGQTLQFADNFTQGSTQSFAYTNGTLDANSKSVILGSFTITTGTHAIVNGTVICASATHTSGDLSIGLGYLLAVSNTYTFTAGSITINNSANLNVGLFSSANTNTRSIAFGTGSITTTSTGTVWNLTAVTGLTYTGTPKVVISNNTATAVTITNTATSTTAFNFNVINGTYSLSLTTGNTYNDLNFTGFAGTIAFAATTHLIYGNLTLGSSTSSSATAGTNNLQWTSTSGTRTITTNGATVNFGILINGVGQTLQLADAFVQGSVQRLSLTNGTFDMASYSTAAGTLVIATGTHAITNGTLNCNTVTHSSGDLSIGTGYFVVCSSTYTLTSGSITINNGVTLTVGLFSSANTGTRSIAFGTGNILVTSTGTVWNVTAVTGFTYTGTPTVNIDNNTATAVTVTNTATAASALNFNFISGTYTLTLTTGNSYNNLSFSGFGGTVAFVATTHTMYGNLTLGSTAVTSATAGTNTLSWVSTSGTRTITSNGSTANFGISLNGVGQTLQLADAFIQGSTQNFAYTNGTFDMATYSTAIGIFTITTGTHAIANGTLNCASVTHTSGDLTTGTGYLVVCSGTYTFTAGSITINDNVNMSVGVFSSSGSAARSIAFGTGGSITLTLSAGGVIWNTATATSFSYTGTSNITVNGPTAASTITTGAMTAAQALNFNFTAGNYSLTTTTASVFNNLDFTGFSGTYAQAATSITVYGNLNLGATMSGSTTTGILSMVSTSGTKTLSFSGTTGPSINMTINGAGGTFQLATTNFKIGGSFVLTAGTLDLNDNDLTSRTFVSTGTGVRVISSSIGTGMINTTGSGTALNIAGSNITSSGVWGIRISNPGATATTVTNALFPVSTYITLGTYTLTLTSGNVYYDLDFTGFAGTWAAAATTHTVYNNLTLGASTVTTSTAGANNLQWTATSGTRTITTNGATVNVGILINGIGQTLQFADNFTQGSTSNLSLTNGTIDINSKITSAGTLVVTSGTHAIANGTLNCASVTHTSGDLTIGTGYVVTCSGTYTFTAGTINVNNGIDFSVGQFSSSNANARSITLGTSIVKLTGPGTAWDTTTITNFTYSGPKTVQLTYSGATAVTISTGAMSEANALDFYITAGTYTLSITDTSSFRTLDFTGFSGTYDQAAASITVYGNLTYSGVMTTSTTGGIIVMGATSGTKNITSNGISVINNYISINGLGGTFKLIDNFICNYTLTLANGTLDINSKTTNMDTLNVLAGTHSFINGNINCTYVTHTSGDLSVGAGYNVICAFSYTFTAGSITINDGVSLSMNSLSSSNTNVRSIAFGTGKILLTGSIIATPWAFTYTNFSYTGTSNITLTYSGAGTVTLNTGAPTEAQSLNFYVTSGSYTLGIANGSAMDTLDLTGFTGTFNLGANAITLYGNLTFPSTMTTPAAPSPGQTYTFAATSGTNTIDFGGQSIGNVVIDGLGGTFLAYSISVNSNYSLTLKNGTLNLNNSNIYAGSSLIILAGTHSFTNGTITCENVTHTSGDLSIGTGYNIIIQSGSYTFTAGSITINDGATLTVNSFTSTNTNTRSIAFGTGSIKTVLSGTPWNVTGVTGLSYTGTPNVNITPNSLSSAITVTNTATAANAFNFNFTKGTYALTLTNGNSFNNLNFTGFGGSIAFGTNTYNIYGNLTLNSTTTTSATAGTDTFTWTSTSGTRTITTNGATANFGIAINGAGQTIQLGSNFTQGSAYTLSLVNGTLDINNKTTSIGILSLTTGTKTFINGTLNCTSVSHTSGTMTYDSTATLNCLGTYTHTAGLIDLGANVNLKTFIYNQPGTLTRSIAFGTNSLITLTGYGTVWNGLASSWSYTGTSKIVVNNSTANSIILSPITTTLAGALNFYVNTGNYTLSLANSSQYNILDFTGFSGTFDMGTASTVHYSDLIISSTMTTAGTTGLVSFQGSTQNLNTNNRTINFNIEFNSSAGNLTLLNNTTLAVSKTFSLIRGTITLSTYKLTTGIMNIDSTYSTPSKTIDFSSGGYIVVNGTSGTILTSTYSSFTGTSRIDITSAATSGTTITLGIGGLGSTVPYYNLNITTGAYNLSFTASTYPRINNLNFTGFSGNFTNGTNALNFTGDITLSTGMSVAGTGTLIFDSGSSTVTSNGKTFTQDVSISGGSLVLAGAFITTHSNGINHSTGTLTTLNYNLTAVSYTTVSGTKTVNLGSSTFTITGSGAAWTVGNIASGLTFNAGTSTISFTSASSKTFSGNGNTYYKLNQGGAGVLTVVGSNTFNDITATTRPSTISLTLGSTQTVSNFSLQGTAGNLVTLNSTSAGSRATLSKSSGTVTSRYLSIKDSAATGGATWNAPSNYGNVNVSNNTGWNFASIATNTGNFFAFFAGL